MSADSGTVRTKKPSSYLQKLSENPRLPQKSASVQRTSSRRALGDLTNRAPKSVQKPKDDVTCAKKKPARIETEDLDEIEIGPPPENNEKWVEPPYFKALTTILSGSLIKPYDEIPPADIFPEPKMETSRRPPYPLHAELFSSSCSPVIDICDISPFDVDEDFRKYFD
ncbi:hypothetical protein EMCRGX_G001252 [Ephydatia muelleri]|eukprot:Em0001g1093a